MYTKDYPPADIEAIISFVTTEDGGRKTPAFSRYRPDHDFGVAGMLNGAQHEFVDCEQAYPGDVIESRMCFLAPEFQVGRLYVGMPFTVQEGAKIVANGIVTKILNPALGVTEYPA